MNIDRDLVSCTPKKFFRVCQKQKKTQNISALGSSPFHLLGFLFLMGKKRQCFLGKDFGGGGSGIKHKQNYTAERIWAVQACMRNYWSKTAGWGWSHCRMQEKRKTDWQSFQNIPPTCRLPAILICVRWEAACSHSGLHVLRCVHHVMDLQNVNRDI